MKTLPASFYTIPRYANTTMSKKDLKELLLNLDGWVLSCGYGWDIKSKHLGAGIYKVSLEQQDKD